MPVVGSGGPFEPFECVTGEPAQQIRWWEAVLLVVVFIPVVALLVL